MVNDRRSHPTVRPHALALGVLERPGAAERLSFLGASLAEELAQAMMLDTLGCLSTFPVRHRYVFDGASGGAAASAKLPATWKRHALAPAAEARGPTSLVASTFAHLFSLGCEASLLVATDGPVLPLGELFDGLLALTQPGSGETILVGQVAGGAVYAVGMARDHGSITHDLAWSGGAVEDALRASASARNVAIRTCTSGYLVDSVEGLRHLAKEVDAGAFAPNCRKLLERPEMRRALA